MKKNAKGLLNVSEVIGLTPKKGPPPPLIHIDVHRIPDEPKDNDFGYWKYTWSFSVWYLDI